jgi:hypothetical protein
MLLEQTRPFSTTPVSKQAGASWSFLPSLYQLLVCNWQCLCLLHKEREITWRLISVMTYIFMEEERRNAHQ